jgi:hypothetical protein
MQVVAAMAAAASDSEHREGLQRFLFKLVEDRVYTHIGNAIGMLIIAFLGRVVAMLAVPAAIAIAKHKVTHPFGKVILPSIVGDWLIGSAGWTSGDGGRRLRDRHCLTPVTGHPDLRQPHRRVRLPA